MLNNLSNDLDIVLSGKTSPYVARTRLERVLLKIEKAARSQNDSEVAVLTRDIINKLGYLSDKSNQTADGVPSSLVFLKPDLNRLFTMLNHTEPLH